MTYTDGQYNGGAVPANTGSEQRMGYSALRIGASPPTYSTIDSTIKNRHYNGLINRCLIIRNRVFCVKSARRTPIILNMSQSCHDKHILQSIAEQINREIPHFAVGKFPILLWAISPRSGTQVKQWRATGAKRKHLKHDTLQEVFHREVKQLTRQKQCQCRLARIVRNPIGCAF